MGHTCGEFSKLYQCGGNGRSRAVEVCTIISQITLGKRYVGSPSQGRLFLVILFDMGDMEGVYRHHGGYLCVIIFLYQWEGLAHNVTMDKSP